MLVQTRPNLIVVWQDPSSTNPITAAARGAMYQSMYQSTPPGVPAFPPLSRHIAPSSMYTPEISTRQPAVQAFLERCMLSTRVSTSASAHRFEPERCALH